MRGKQLVSKVRGKAAKSTSKHNGPPRGVSKATWLLLRNPTMRAKLRVYAEDSERTRDKVSGFIAGLYASRGSDDND